MLALFGEKIQLNVKIVKTNSPQIDLDAPTPSTSSSVIEFPDRIGPGPSELGKRVPCPVCFVSILEKLSISLVDYQFIKI